MPQRMRRGQSVCSLLGPGVVRSDTSPLPVGAGAGDCTFAGAGDGWGFKCGLLAHMPVEDLPLQVQPLLFIFMFIPSGQQLLSFMFSPQATFPSEQQKN